MWQLFAYHSMIGKKLECVYGYCDVPVGNRSELGPSNAASQMKCVCVHCSQNYVSWMGCNFTCAP